MAAGDHHVVELKAGGAEDPDGSRATEVLRAYFRAEQTRSFRRVVWRGLAVCAIPWALVGRLTSLISSMSVFAGLALFAAAAIGAAVVEWRASETLKNLLEIH